MFQGTSSGTNLRTTKTGKRYMKQYREKFVQYFPTLVAELTERKLFDSCLNDTSEHLKEVILNALPLYLAMTLSVGC